jgi:hypothetical protein
MRAGRLAADPPFTARAWLQQLWLPRVSSGICGVALAPVSTKLAAMEFQMASNFHDLS